MLVLLLWASAASAMKVTTTSDATASGNHVCSLREAIQAVNAGKNSADCGKVVSAGVTPIALPAGDYTLTHGELLIGASAKLAITGASSSVPAHTLISGGGKSRVFDVAAGANVTMSALEITGGKSPNGSNAMTPAGPGYSGENGGGIRNAGTLTLRHVLVTGNATGHGGRGGDGTADPIPNTGAAGGGGMGGNGGGISNESGGTLMVDLSTITGNHTGGGGAGGNGAGGVAAANHYLKGGPGGAGAGGGTGGGIYNAGSATITRTTISHNHTSPGGHGGDGGKGGAENGVYAVGGPGGPGGGEGCTDSYCNALIGAAADGGGINNAGTLTMSDSTINGNTTAAGATGGNGGNGAGNGASGGDGGHGAPGGSGGGLLDLPSQASLTNVTIQGNATGAGGHGGDAGTTPLNGGTGGNGGNGGGILGGQALTHVTIAGNSVGAAGTGGVGYNNQSFPGNRGIGAGFEGLGGTETNSIVVFNGDVLSNDHNCAGSVNDGGHNITFHDATCPGTNANPGLGSLGNHGGPTQTMLPAAPGAAVDVIPAAACPVKQDQRLLPRPDSGEPQCDAGAVET